MPGARVAEWLDQNGFSANFQANLFASVLAFVVGWVLNQLLQRFIIKRVKNPTVRRSARKVVKYSLLVAVLLLVGRLWYSGIDSFATIIGLVSAGVAIALKDPVTNLAGWAFLVVRHPFRIGDRIQIGEYAGDVMDISLFQFSIQEVGAWVDADQPTGRVVHLPNGMVFNQPQVNYHRGLPYIWDELLVVLTFESDWEAGKAVFEDIAKANAISDPSFANLPGSSVGESGYFMLERNVESTVYTLVRDSGVELGIRYAVDPRQRRAMKSTMWEAVLHAVAAHPGLDFAYPTYRLYSLPGQSEAAGPGETALPPRTTSAKTSLQEHS